MASNNRKGVNAPVHSKNSGLTSAAVFTNERTNSKTGDKFTAVDVALGQGYVDKKGNIQKSGSMSVNQALRAEHLLHNAIDVAMDEETAAKRRHGGEGKFAARERQREDNRSAERDL